MVEDDRVKEYAEDLLKTLNRQETQLSHALSKGTLRRNMDVSFAHGWWFIDDKKQNYGIAEVTDMYAGMVFDELLTKVFEKEKELGYPLCTGPDSDFVQGVLLKVASSALKRISDDFGQIEG